MADAEEEVAAPEEGVEEAEVDLDAESEEVPSAQPVNDAEAATGDEDELSPIEEEDGANQPELATTPPPRASTTPQPSRSAAPSRGATPKPVDVDPSTRELLASIAPVENKEAKSASLQIKDMRKLISQIPEDQRIEMPEVDDIEQELGNLEIQEDQQLSLLLRLRHQLEQLMSSKGAPLAQQDTLQYKVHQIVGDSKKAGSRRGSMTYKGRGSRPGSALMQHVTEERQKMADKAAAEKRKQDEEMKRLADDNKKLGEKVSELEKLLEESLKEAKVNVKEASKHDRLTNDLYSENAQLAVALEKSEDSKRRLERQVLVLTDKNKAVMDTFRKCVLISTSKK